MQGRLLWMAVGLALVLAALAPAAAGAQEGDVVAEGHIEAGLWTSSNVLSTSSITNCAAEEVESFCFHDPPTDATLKTVTETPSDEFNVDIWFHEDVDGPSGFLPFNTFIDGCSVGSYDLPGTAGDETGCDVPDDADWGTVDATWGQDLDVQLVVQSTGG